MTSVNNDYSSLFGSLSTSSSSSSSSTYLADWASLKNGSYAKLTKAYYNKSESMNSGSKVDANKEAIKANNKSKTAATDLKDSLASVKDADSLEKFVEKYNAMISDGGESDSQGVLRNTLSITNLSEAHKNTLSKLGITIGEDNKLTLNKDTAEKASASDYNALFKGSGSYGDLVATRATEMVNRINTENNKMSNYTAGGSYVSAGAVGNIYDGSY